MSSCKINLQLQRLAFFDRDIDAAATKSNFDRESKHSLKDCCCWRSPDRNLDIVAAHSLVSQQQPAPNLPQLVPAHVVELGFLRLGQQHATFDDDAEKIQNACRIARLEGSTTTRRIGRSLDKALHGLRLGVLRQPFPDLLHLPAKKMSSTIMRLT